MVTSVTQHPNIPHDDRISYRSDVKRDLLHFLYVFHIVYEYERRKAKDGRKTFIDLKNWKYGIATIYDRKGIVSEQE